MFLLVNNAVADLLVLPCVYPDNVLVVGDIRVLKPAVHRFKAKLNNAKFVLSSKSEVTPDVELGFIGKIFNTETRVMQNRKGMVSGLIRAWFKLVLGNCRDRGWNASWDVWSGHYDRRRGLRLSWRGVQMECE